MDKKILIQKMKMPIEELEEYHRRQRAISYERNEPIKGIRWRQRLHFLLTLGLGVSRVISREKLCIVQDRHTDVGKPLIYAATHIGWHDVEMTFASIKSHAYALWGDPGEMYRRIEMLLFSFNGAVEIAIRSGCEIVPVAVEQYDKHYYVNIGGNIDLSGYEISQKREATEYLRDTLCTLKWEIWEKHGKALRKEIPEGYSKTFLAQYEAQTDEAYTLEDIRNTRYHPKTASPEEAFSFIYDLRPCRENAFIFRGNMRNTECLRKN